MRIRNIIVLLFFGTSYTCFAQMGSFGKWELLYSDASIKIEIAFRIKPCLLGKESNSISKYKYRVTGSPKSGNSYYLNWKMDYIDCNGNLNYRNNALNIGISNSHFSGYVSNLVILAEDEDFTCNSMVSNHYDEAISYSKSYGGGIKTLQLRKASAKDLQDIWNNKYGVNPERRQKLIAAGIDPEDAQRRINAGEGKPNQSPEFKQEITLDISKEKLVFSSHGGTETIYVYTNSSDYQIAFLPSWCNVTYKNDKWFSIYCAENSSSIDRIDWFKVKADLKEIRVDIKQTGNQKNSNERTFSLPYPEKKSTINTSKCFNCPKTNEIIGSSFGLTTDYRNLTWFTAGVRIEPLFKYGFGLNSGLFFKVSSSEYIAINIPFSLEYRLNFSKKFSMFGYGGFAFNIDIDPNYGYYLPITFDYGVGLRIKRFQVNIGKSLFIGDLRGVENKLNIFNVFSSIDLSCTFFIPVEKNTSF